MQLLPHGRRDVAFYGGVGNDILQTLGTDRTVPVFGGDGDDTLESRARVMYGEAGADTVSGFSDGSILFGGSGPDMLRALEAGSTLYGSSEWDTLQGDNSSTLYGGTERDRLAGGHAFGGEGDDFMFCRVGSTLTGDAGADIFLLGRSSVTGRAIVTDFDPSTEKLSVASYYLAYPTPGSYVYKGVTGIADLSPVQVGNDTELSFQYTNSIDTFTLTVVLLGVDASLLTDAILY